MIISSEKGQMHAFGEQVSALAELLKQRELLITSVESCTGGGVAASFTDLPGSSDWFERGFVTYSNAAKMEMVGVRAETLAQYGAVSEPVAREMAAGGIRHSAADCALAITGIAGPGGGSDKKPVGMVCFAWSGPGMEIQAETKYFQGDRGEVRFLSAFHSVQKARTLFDGNYSASSPDTG